MKVYDYKQLNNCVICGSIENGIDTFIENIIKKLPNKKSFIARVHPKEVERQERLQRKREEMSIRERLDFLGRRDTWRNPFEDGPNLMGLKKSSREDYVSENTLLVVCGVCWIGGKDINYYLSKFNELNRILADNNTHILFVRGSQDDPQIFNNELINLSNIKTIPDYSVLMLESFNCLCIGGSISIDREWKKLQEQRIGRKLYWEEENFVYKENEIEEILNKYDIACVITNTCPSFVFPGTNSFNKSSWALKDKKILKDILDERKQMDKVYERIIDKNKKPFVWVYSKYGVDNQNVVNDIVFQSLCKQSFLSFNNVVESNFGVRFNKKLAYNQEIMDEIIKKCNEFRYVNTTVDEDMEWLDVENNDDENVLPDDFFEERIMNEEEMVLEEIRNGTNE